MHKTSTKPVYKQKERKKLGLNIKSANLNQSNIMDNDNDGHKRKVQHPSLNTGQARLNFKVSSQSEKVCYEEFEKNDNCHPELLHLQEKMAELVHQRDDLLKCHNILAGLDQNNGFKNINPSSVLSEIYDLKSMIGMLQQGVSIILDEHSFIKNVIINQVKDIDNLLERSLNESGRKSKPNASVHQEKYLGLSSIFKENNGFIPSGSFNSNQRLFDLCKPSSIFNHTNSYTAMNKINYSVKCDSMDEFRQLAELKIVIEILQKYSKIVTNEFRNLSRNVEISDHNCFDRKYTTNIDQEDCKSHLKTVSELENNLEDSFYFYPANSDPKSKIKTPEKRPGLSQSDLNINLKQKIAAGDVYEDMLQTPLNILKSNPSKYRMNNEIFNFEESSVNKDKMLSRRKDADLCQQSLFRRVSTSSSNESFICHQIVSAGLVDGVQGQLDKPRIKNKVLFLSDGHGRYCSQFLQDELGSNFSVISVLKPDSLFKEIIEDYHHLASSFSRKDYVIVFAGINNLKCKDRSQSDIELELLLQTFKHTNVIYTRIPLLLDQPLLNTRIRRVNSENNKKIHELAKNHSNILFMPNFTLFSKEQQTKLNFNKIGKKSLCKLLAKTILTHCFNKRPRPFVKSQYIKPIRALSTKLPQDIELSNLDYVDEKKASLTVNNGESVKYKGHTPKDNMSMKVHLADKYKLNESMELIQKSAQTQTSKVNLNESFSQKANYEFYIHNSKILSDERPWPISKNYVEEAKPFTQSKMVEQDFNIHQCLGDNYKGSKFEDNNQPQGFFAGIFMKNSQANMTTIKELLGQGDIPKPRKNFIQENVKKLKELKLEKTNKLGSQRSKNMQPLVDRRNAGTMVSSSRFSHRSTVNRSGHLSSGQQPSPPPPRSRLTNRHVTLDTQPPAVVEVDDSPKGYRSLGCQTLSGPQLERLYDEGVIRYPSVRDMSGGGERQGGMREMALQTEEMVPLEVLHAPPPPPPPDDGLHWDEERKAEDRDFVKMNAAVPDPRRHKTPDPSSTDPNRAPPTYQRGVVPRYLREHKKEMERERMNKAKEDECPEGHIQLPEDIKQKHLTTLRQNYAELVSQLNQLPVSTDTLRTRTRKKQIESDLDRIEAAIALFSREKVFVKADS